MSDSYLQVSVSLPAGSGEEISEICRIHRCLGSEFRAGGEGWERVLIYLKQEDSQVIPEIRSSLEKLGSRDILVEEREVEDWLENYRRNLKAFPVGRSWWIDPDPEGKRPVPEGRIRIVMEPRTAFGSGSHETTQLMLEALEGEELVGARVLDLGSGSGILSLAALACGAESVVGVDLDLQSVFVASQLLSDQDVNFRPLYIAGEIEALVEDLQCDFILCNMLSKYFFPLLEAMVSRLCPGGVLLLSGLLEEEEESVLERAKELDLVLKASAHCVEWALLRLERA